MSPTLRLTVLLLGAWACTPPATPTTPPADSADSDTELPPPDDSDPPVDTEASSDSEPADSDTLTDSEPVDSDTLIDSDTDLPIDSGIDRETGGPLDSPTEDTGPDTDIEPPEDTFDTVDTLPDDTSPFDSDETGQTDETGDTGETGGSDDSDGPDSDDTGHCPAGYVEVTVGVIEPGATCREGPQQVTVCRTGWEQYLRPAQNGCYDLFVPVLHDDGTCLIRMLECNDPFEFTRDPDYSTDCSLNPLCCPPVAVDDYVPVCPWDSGGP